MTDSKLIAVSNIVSALIIDGAPLSNPTQVQAVVNAALDILSIAENQERALAQATENATKARWSSNSPDKSRTAPGQPARV